MGGVGVSDENFEDLSSFVRSENFSANPIGQRLNNSQEHFSRLLHITRKNNCAQTMLDLEKRIKSNLKSSHFLPSPALSFSPKNNENKLISNRKLLKSQNVIVNPQVEARAIKIEKNDFLRVSHN